MTRALAEPLCTLVPRNARVESSSGVGAGAGEGAVAGVGAGAAAGGVGAGLGGGGGGGAGGGGGGWGGVAFAFGLAFVFALSFLVVTWTGVGSNACFSTGKLSPVSDPWLTNRSLAWRMRTSPGIMSPAASWTTSPGTNWPRGTSRGSPSRTTVALTEIIALSLAAALSARASW